MPGNLSGLQFHLWEGKHLFNTDVWDRMNFNLGIYLKLGNWAII